MTASPHPELFWLTLTVLMTALFWLPYVANRFRELGPPGWAWFPPADPPHRAAWANRAAQAHVNAVENLLIFAPLALTVHVAGCGSALTAHACFVNFIARAAHYGIGIAGLPIPLRTVAFLTGFAAQLTLAGVLLLGL